MSDLSIKDGKFFNHDKQMFVTCPFNHHEPCVPSCALNDIVRHEVADHINGDYCYTEVSFGCGCGPNNFDLVDANGNKKTRKKKS